jgi:hypothetical protein
VGNNLPTYDDRMAAIRQAAGRCARPAHQRRASRRRLALHLGPADVGATGRHASSAGPLWHRCLRRRALSGAPNDEGELACAAPTGSWRTFACLFLSSARRGADAAISLTPCTTRFQASTTTIGFVACVSPPTGSPAAHVQPAVGACDGPQTACETCSCLSRSPVEPTPPDFPGQPGR